MRRIVVTGSLAFDQIMNLPGKFADHIDPTKLHILNISFLVDSLRKEHGGTGGNISYNLALLGMNPELVASIGGDGGVYLKRLKKSGVGIGGVKKHGDVKTAVGNVITDKDDNQIWVFYVGAMKKYAPTPKLNKEDFVVISPNDPKATVRYVDECVKRGVDFMYDPAFQIPHYSKVQLRKAVNNAEIVIGNDYEIGQIKKQVKIPKDKILITTLGSKGSMIEKSGKKILVPVAKPKNISDPTGAGDAYRAGFLAGYIQGRTLDVCGRMGAVCAAYTVEKYGTQTLDH